MKEVKRKYKVTNTYIHSDPKEREAALKERLVEAAKEFRRLSDSG